MKFTLRLIIANILLVICAVLGASLPGLWSGVTGRDFRPQAVNAGILIFVFSVLLRYRFKWPGKQMLIFLLPNQLIILLVISYFSGYSGTEYFNEFNLHWLLYIDFFIALPWIMGIITGSIILNKKSLRGSE